MKTTKKEIIKKYKDAKIISCAYRPDDKYDLSDVDWGTLELRDNSDVLIKCNSVNTADNRVYLYDNDTKKYAKILEYKVKEKLYTLKKECEKYYPISKHTNKAYPIGEWGVPLTMLDEVIPFNTVSLSYNNGLYNYEFKANPDVDVFELNRYLTKATKEFFKL
jgi:hypothetical protein